MNEKNSQTGTISAQARAFGALADMARAFPHLPAVFSRVYMDGEDVLLQADTTDAFEAWRVALSIPSAAVEVKEYNGAHWLRAQGVWAGVAVDLTSHSVVIPEELPVSGLPSEWSAAVSA